jgi:uncharacterized membrane protein YeaQ/YmgE (transglycosylase-associated protein family)
VGNDAETVRWLLTVVEVRVTNTAAEIQKRKGWVMDVVKVSKIVTLLLVCVCVLFSLAPSICEENGGKKQLSEKAEVGESRITFPEVVAWLVVGALAGSLAGTLVTRKKKGFGRAKNLGLGLLGALIGGGLINLFKIDFGLGEVRIGFDELIAAFVCSLILLIAGWWLKRSRKSKREKAARVGGPGASPPSTRGDHLN